MTIALEPVVRLGRDITKALRSEGLSRSEARFLVDAYYMMQDDRKRAANQVRALEEGDEPHSVLGWLAAQSGTMEKQVLLALDAYSDSTETGQWAKSVYGIGPVIAAGLEAHIDIAMAPTVGHIWRFAGLDPTQTWGKGEKRPWNAKLKVLCFHIGESFKKFHNRPECKFGLLYKQRKEYEVARNDSGGNAQAAANALQAKSYGKETDAFAHLSAGKLPPAQLDRRACRWATKQFLACWHEVAYKAHFGVAPPFPYPMAHLGHAHMRTAMEMVS